MKATTHKMALVGLMVISVALTGYAETLTVTAELDKPVLLTDTPQTIHLRIGLTGCALETLTERPPVNVALVIDKSGSMRGERIRQAREAAIMALRRLDENDIVSVVVFDSDVRVLVPATKMTCREDIIRQIRGIAAGGTTALYAGVQAGAQEVQKFYSANRVNRVILLSDGHANVGPRTPQELGHLGARLSEKGLSVSTIGLGLSYNEDLMSILAYKSDGAHYFSESPAELASVFEREFERTLSVVAQEIRIKIVLPKGVRPVRLLGRQGQIDKQTVEINMGSAYSEHETYVLLEAEVDSVQPGGTSIPLADVSVQYRDMKSAQLRAENRYVKASLTTDEQTVDKHLNHRVMADVVEQIAIERNEQATALRDAGNVEKAQQVLQENSLFLRSNAVRLKSAALEQYAEENAAAADRLDGADWNRTRKAMRESQTSRRTQQ